MAETRKFDPSGSDGLQKLVREALGETTRPFSPGDEAFRTEQVEPQDAPGADALQAAKVPDHILYGLGNGGGGSW